MAVYDSTQTVKKSLQQYFIKENLGEDGGVSKDWGKIKVGGFYIPIPNIKARKKVLVLHDIHHVVTGYDGDWKGEVSIGAWEVASGCGKYYVAWYFNSGAMIVGLFIYPGHVLHSFVRGKRTENLYHQTFSQEQALMMPVGELQMKLKLDQHMEQKITLSEMVSFLYWTVIALAISLSPLILLYLVFKLLANLF